MRRIAMALLPLFCVLLTFAAGAQGAEKWVTAWAGSAQGPYPVGNPLLQPDLSRVFPSPVTGARDQSFRLIVRPDIWGGEARIRLSNAFGTKPVTFDGVFIGLHLDSSAVAAGTNSPATFSGSASVTIEPGGSAWSDAVKLPFAEGALPPGLQSMTLAVSFHIAGESGPMTWHALGLTTSYVSPPGAGAVGADEDEAAFPFSTASWYFLDALDMKVQDSTQLIAALGDSVTDGNAATLNGADRWPDVLSRRLHAKFGSRFSVVNAGIGGNRITGPDSYSPQTPSPGGPSALQRLERDVLGLSGISAVIWFEGINDFSKNHNVSVETVENALREGVRVIRSRIPNVRVIGGTLTTAHRNTGAAHVFTERDLKREALNRFIRGSGLFDGVIDFDKAILDQETGEMRPEFVPDSTAGGPGDKLHPNRLGHLAMGESIDLNLFGQPPP